MALSAYNHQVGEEVEEKLKNIRLAVILSGILLVSACTNKEDDVSQQGSVNDGEATSGYGTIDHGVEDQSIGFNMEGNTIEEVENIPPAEKDTILQAFDAYMDAFNKKDMERYMDALSDTTESFQKEEERDYLESVFEEYDLSREASDITIVKYSKDQAQVFTRLQTTMKQLSTGLETNSTGRQVTVFTKEDGKWKVTSVHYIDDELKQ